MAGFFDKDTFQNILDYTLILAVLVVAGYYIYKIIMEKKDSKVVKPPPFDDTPNASQRSQLSKIEGITSTSSVKNASFDASSDNALRNYFIKGSSNSAYTGGYMNLNMIKYVLSKGCRFLDFEIYMKDNVPVVAYNSNQRALENFSSAPPAISFSGVCSTVISNAFSETSPNPDDPLFLHLRIKTYDSSAFSKVGKIIKTTLGPKLYTESDKTAVPVNLDTQLPSLLGKVIVMVDQHSSPGYQNYSVCEPDNVDCYALKNVVNMVTNSNNVRSYTESELTYQPINPPDPNVYLFRIVYPNLGFFGNAYNPDTQYLVKNYGTQIVAPAFYVNDSNLRTYNSIFSNNKSAFVRMETMLNSYE